ncbi:response regulator [Sporolituus thermophilus]|nr:response regulator transcription factor [Sporolituus thermophilus]
MAKIKIILADDHAVLRAGLKLLLNNEPDFTVAGEAADGQQVLRLLERETADVLILDLAMPVMGGLEVIRELKSRGCPVKILVLTMHEDEQYLKEAMRIGALGYVEKKAVDTELFQAIRTVAKGRRYLNPAKTQELLGSLLAGAAAHPADDPYTLLSFREREVLKYMVRGYSLSEIAKMLCISVKTVDTHKTRIMNKLGYTEKSQLVEYALKHGLLTTKLTR